jgi:chemotaxis response regulator CheB
MDESPLDTILSTAAAVFSERLTVAFLSGAEIGRLKGVEAVRSGGGRIVVADPLLAVVADTLEVLVDSALVDQVAAPADIMTHLITD